MKLKELGRALWVTFAFYKAIVTSVYKLKGARHAIIAVFKLPSSMIHHLVLNYRIMVAMGDLQKPIIKVEENL